MSNPFRDRTPVDYARAILRARKWLREPNVLTAGGLVLGLGLAILVRIPLLGFKSVDYYNEVVQSYPLIQTQGFAALASNASNYNPPYFYLLYVVSRLLPGLPMIAAVKLPAMLADGVCALFVALIVRLKYKQGPAWLGAGFAVLMAPTVVVNSAFWGQVDSIHTAGILACVYFLLRRQGALAILAFALALTFKLQAIFIAPLLLASFLRKEISWRPFLLIPVVFLLALVPAWIAGRSLLDLLTIYARQTSQYETLTMNAASIYTWIPNTKEAFHDLYLPSLIVGMAATFLLVIVVLKSAKPLTTPLLLELALLTVLVVPFFLPKMHDRYFFPADVLSIAFAWYWPQFFYIPIAVVGASSLAYLPFLFGVEPVPLPFLTLVLLAVICLLAYHAIRQLYFSPDTETGQSGLLDTDMAEPLGDAA